MSERCWESSRPQLEVGPCSTTGQRLHPLHRSRLASGYHRCGLGMAHRVHVHVLAPASGAAATEAAVFGARAVVAGRLAVWLVLPRLQQQGSLAAPGVAARTTQQAIGGTNMEGTHEVKCSSVMMAEELTASSPPSLPPHPRNPRLLTAACSRSCSSCCFTWRAICTGLEALHRVDPAGKPHRGTHTPTGWDIFTVYGHARTTTSTNNTIGNATPVK